MQIVHMKKPKSQGVVPAVEVQLLETGWALWTKLESGTGICCCELLVRYLSSLLLLTLTAYGRPAGLSDLSGNVPVLLPYSACMTAPLKRGIVLFFRGFHTDPLILLWRSFTWFTAEKKSYISLTGVLFVLKLKLLWLWGSSLLKSSRGLVGPEWRADLFRCFRPVPATRQ